MFMLGSLVTGWLPCPTYKHPGDAMMSSAHTMPSMPLLTMTLPNGQQAWLMKRCVDDTVDGAEIPNNHLGWCYNPKK